MKKVIVSAAAALALVVATAGSASAGQVYGNYGGPTAGYGAPAYGPGPGYGPNYAGPPPGYYGRGAYRRHCGGDRVAGTIVGGVLGGIIGNNIGGRRHRGGRTVAGVLLGGLAGNAIAGSGCRHHYDRYDDRRAYGPPDVYRGGAYGGDPRYDDRYEPGYDDGAYGPDDDDGAYGPGYDGGYDDDVPYEDRPYDGR
jgi:hypothetical protein